ncbi:MAG: ABC transporter ATP-binding protein [Chloroflexaceae bacterium]|nr:ABC transporter ATP-binding protein [Chloroflexaceae bacterium]
MAPIIEFNNVSKRFTLRRTQQTSLRDRITNLAQSRPHGEEFWALRDVSFTVEKGESIGLIGHNGAGKSTALKLMTRILEPTSGTVQIGGRVAALLELGSGFHPDLSGRENVFLYGSLMGLGRRDMQQRLDAIVEFADIGNFFDTEVKHYSSGMYTRLAFAVATEVDPEILITDEVLAVGDESFQRRCMERIYRFRRMGKTIVFVSHALEVVRTLCEQAVWLDHGVAREVGPSSEVIDAYLADVNRRERERLDQMRGEADNAATTVSDADAAWRYGSRDLEITDVELLNEAGLPRNIFHTLETVVVRMHYLAHTPVQWPVFGIALYHGNGLWLTGPNSAFDGIDIPEVSGRGYVDYIIPVLPLLTGRYALTVAVFDETMLHPYDYHDRHYQLVVQTRRLRERYGTLTLSGTWAWSNNPSRAAEVYAAPTSDSPLSGEI